MRIRLVLAAVAAAACLPVAPAAAQDTGRLIVVHDSGEIVRVGAFTPRQYLGTRRYAGVAPIRRNAIRAYGTPDRRDSAGCLNRWTGLGVRILTADFGGGDACAPGAGIQRVRVSGRGGAAWRTDRGIRLGSTLAEVRAAYPETRSYRSAYGRIPGFGGMYGLVFEPGHQGPLDRLAAELRDGKVVALEVSPYGAGD